MSLIFIKEQKIVQNFCVSKQLRWIISYSKKIKLKLLKENQTEGQCRHSAQTLENVVGKVWWKESKPNQEEDNEKEVEVVEIAGNKDKDDTEEIFQRFLSNKERVFKRISHKFSSKYIQKV